MALRGNATPMSTLSPAVADIIRQYAPTAATVLGNVLLPGAGGMIAGGLAKVAVDQLTPKGKVAVDVIGDKLGITKPTLERINAVVNASLEARPDAMFKEEVTKRLEQADGIVALRLAEMAHVEEMAKLDNADVADARVAYRAHRELTPPIISYILIIALIMYYAAGYLIEAPAANREFLAGGGKVLETLATAAVFFWVGSSRSSQRNGDALRGELAKR